MARAERVLDPKIAFIGNEPDSEKIKKNSSNYSSLVGNALNWYSFDGNKNTARKYLREYIRRQKIGDVKKFDAVSDREIIPTWGWVARLMTRGAEFSDNHVLRFNEYIKGLLEPKNETKIEDTTRLTIQESMQQKIKNYLGELENVLDSFLKTKDFSFCIETDLKQKEIPQAYTPHIIQWGKNKLREIIEVIEGKCPQLNEGYSNISKKKMREYAKFLGNFVQTVEKYADFRKANRKPRVVKPKSPAQQTKNLKYRVKYEEIGVSSVIPVEIIGAQSVWFYNTKTKKMSVYRTDSALGLQMKGQTVQNYDPEMSEQKTIRKPEETIKNLLGANKVATRKFLDTISTKKQSVNGRINADTLILRVTK